MGVKYNLISHFYCRKHVNKGVKKLFLPDPRKKPGYSKFGSKDPGVDSDEDDLLQDSSASSNSSRSLGDDINSSGGGASFQV